MKSCKGLVWLPINGNFLVNSLLFPQVFHVFIVQKCIGDPESILPIDGIDVKKNHSYEEILVQLSWLLIRLLSYGFIMIKLRWIISLSC